MTTKYSSKEIEVNPKRNILTNLFLFNLSLPIINIIKTKFDKRKLPTSYSIRFIYSWFSTFCPTIPITATKVVVRYWHWWNYYIFKFKKGTHHHQNWNWNDKNNTTALLTERNPVFGYRTWINYIPLRMQDLVLLFITITVILLLLFWNQDHTLLCFLLVKGIVMSTQPLYKSSKSQPLYNFVNLWRT